MRGSIEQRLERLEECLISAAGCVCKAPEHQVGILFVDGHHGMWLNPGELMPKSTEYFDCPVHGRRRCATVVTMSPTRCDVLGVKAVADSDLTR